jgi:hypothetical protein
VDHRGQPAALAHAGISLPALEQPDADTPAALSAADRASVAEAAAASVASDVALRSALLEGLCVFASGAVTDGGASAGPEGQAASLAGHSALAEVPRLLAAEVASRAEAAAETALALQHSLRSGQQQPQQEEDEGEEAGGGAAEAPTGAVMVAVPDARAAADGEERGGSLPEIMPASLMLYPSCRAMQLGLLALQVGRAGLACPPKGSSRAAYGKIYAQR